MKYQFLAELDSGSLRMRAETGEVVFDLVEFPVTLRESFRLELQKELKEIFQLEKDLSIEGLLKYIALEKYEDQFYLVRDNYLNIGIRPLQVEDYSQIARILLKALQLMKEYHQQGFKLGGLSLGLLKQDDKGELFFQDPLVMNHLRKFITKDYQVDAPAEVIRGHEWDLKADVFSWGNLAYRLLTGIEPFAANSPEERMEKILKIGAVSLRDVKPQLSEALSRLVMSCLQNDPQKRPSLEMLEMKLAELIDKDLLTVSETEIREYQVKADANLQWYQKKERFLFWFRKFGVVTMITLGVLIAVIVSWVNSQPQPVITDKYRPSQVLSAYFEGVRTLNVTLVDESLHKAKNSFSDMVTNLYVINRTQQGMTYSIKDNALLEYLDLKIIPMREAAEEAKYQANYTLKVAMPTEIHYFQRVDEFTLKPIRKVWRITEIKVLHDKNWIEKKPETKDPTPGNQTVQPTPASSKK